MKQVVLGLGGNIGNVMTTLAKAITEIDSEIGRVELKSSLYKTAAWGVEDQPDFINMVIMLTTNLLPIEVLTKCLSIEKKLGRERGDKEKWSERLIDIDVLFYENETIDSFSLKLPHPYIQERNFVLYPLAEILPELWHPIFKKTVQELKSETKDNQVVSILENKI